MGNTYKDEKGHFTDKEHDGGTCIHEGKHGSVHVNKKGEYEVRDRRGNKVGNGFSNDKEAIEFLDNDYDDEDYEDDVEEKSDKSKSAEDKYDEYAEKGKSTWNQKLNKGQKVIVKDRNGNDMEAYVGGFYNNQKLQDEDTFEEGKENLWHDFRGVQLVDKDGKEVGNINANQIERVVKEENPEEYKPFNGRHNYLVNRMYNSGYDSPEDVLEDAEKWDLTDKEKWGLDQEIKKVFGIDDNELKQAKEKSATNLAEKKKIKNNAKSQDEAMLKRRAEKEKKSEEPVKSPGKIRKHPKNGTEVNYGDKWAQVSEEEYDDLKNGGYEEVDYEEEPGKKENLSKALDELEKLVSESQKEDVKALKKKLLGGNDA